MQINNNVAAFNAYRNLSVSQGQLGKSLEKLSSGFRINRAADDASGLVISEGLRSQIGGLRQATRNAQDGVSVVQTAEGALTEVHSMLQRMRDLAVQVSSTGTYGDDAKAAAQAEFDQLSAEINRIGTSTKFGDQALFDGSLAKVTGVTGVAGVAAEAEVHETNSAVNGTGYDFTDKSGASGANDNATFTISDGTSTATVALTADYSGDTDPVDSFLTEVQSQLDAAGLAYDASVNTDGKLVLTAKTDGARPDLIIEDTVGTLTGEGTLVNDGVDEVVAVTAVTAQDGAVFQVGAFEGDTIAVGIDAISAASLGIDGSTDLTAAGTLDTLDAAIGTVSTQRGALGAVQNRFEHTVANLQVAVENLTASESRIRDTDMAAEMTTFTRNQIMQQAGTAMLAQANQLPQSVLSLLR